MGGLASHCSQVILKEKARHYFKVDDDVDLQWCPPLNFFTFPLFTSKPSLQFDSLFSWFKSPSPFWKSSFYHFRSQVLDPNTQNTPRHLQSLKNHKEQISATHADTAVSADTVRPCSFLGLGWVCVEKADTAVSADTVRPCSPLLPLLAFHLNSSFHAPTFEGSFSNQDCTYTTHQTGSNAPKSTQLNYITIE